MTALLLDTNAYTALGRGHTAVKDLVSSSRRIYFSVIVLGELMDGFRGGSQFDANIAALKRFFGNPLVDLVPATDLTADRYGRIKCALRAKGCPIPTNDIWIAAHAMETGAELISFDAHFD